MISINTESKEVYNEKQKKFYQFLTCVQHAHESFCDIKEYLLFNRKKDVSNKFRRLLNGNRKERKQADVIIKKDVIAFTKSMARFEKMTGELYDAFANTDDKETAKQEGEMSQSIYAFFDAYLLIKEK